MIIEIKDLKKLLNYNYVEDRINNLLELHYVLCSIIKEKLGLKVSNNSSDNFIRNLRLEKRPYLNPITNTLSTVLGLTFYNINKSIELEYNRHILELNEIKQALNELHIQMINPERVYNENSWNGIEDDDQLQFIYYILDFDQEAIDYLRTKIIYYKLMRK